MMPDHLSKKKKKIYDSFSNMLKEAFPRPENQSFSWSDPYCLIQLSQ